MMWKNLSISIALLGQCFFSIAQNSDYGDYNWIHGSIIQLPDGGPLYDNSFKINFANEEVNLSVISKKLSVRGCNASYSDENGKLLMYTNGGHIGDSSLQIMEKGDSILEMSINDIYPYYVHGYPFTKTSMFLPIDSNRYYLLMTLLDTIQLQEVIFTTKYLVYSEIVFDKEHPKGYVAKKRITAWKDRLIGLNTTACRHANGRDWWFITQRDQTGTMLKFLIDSSGIHGPWYQEFPIPLFIAYDGGSMFSPDGTKYCHIDPTFGIQVYDFDRCTGELSNFKYLNMFYKAPIGDIVISPNSRFLYAMTGDHVIQFDLNTSDLASLEASADTVGYTDPKYQFTNFAVSALAPDGKIYITSSGSVENQNYFSIIHNPDRKGKSCRLQLIGIKPPFQNDPGSMPNFPNYRLGPVDGSECDSLGIDNVPKARFRINHDTIAELSKEFTNLSFREPTEWYWTFGDGGNSIEVNPVHIYLNKGEYEVCLTVSNQYGSDTACKTFGVWPVSIDEEVVDGKMIRIYPNPSTNYIQVEGDQVQGAKIELMLMNGQLIKQIDHVYTSKLSIDISDIPSGIYLIRIDTVESGPVVKTFIKQ